MNWYINDLSLDGQFADCHAFKTAIEALLRLRRREPMLRNALYCSRSLYDRQVTRNYKLREAVMGTKDKHFINHVMKWFSKSGPFWEDVRQWNKDDYFEYQSNDVTDQGLGEAARRIIAGFMAGVFSFRGSSFTFEQTPLSVRQGLPEDPKGEIKVENCWTVEQLTKSVRAAKTYHCWQDVNSEINLRFPDLIFAKDVMAPLLSSPFSRQVTNRIFELLNLLNCLVVETDDKGALSAKGKALLKIHFEGQKAWFTDESSRNKKNFKKDLTFKDSEDQNNKLFCPWHGKIKKPQTRIHFEWPRPKGQKKIKVVYIGPKITKS